MPEAVKAGRLAALQQLLEAQQAAFNHACIGRTMPVLLDRPGRKPGQMVGRSPWMQAVHVMAPPERFGRIADIAIDRATANSLAGHLAAAPAAPAARRGRKGLRRVSRRTATGMGTGTALPGPRDGGTSLRFDDNALMSALCGAHDANLARLEQKTGVTIHARGNRLTVTGPDDARVTAVSALKALYKAAGNGGAVAQPDVDAAIRMAGRPQDPAEACRRRHDPDSETDGERPLARPGGLCPGAAGL